MSLYLYIKDGPAKGLRFELEDGLVIGRERTDIALNDPKVSGKHAKIQQNMETGGFSIEDLGSTNGIKFKGQKVHDLVLEAGVVFRLGRTVIEVREEESSREFYRSELPAPDDNRPITKSAVTIPPLEDSQLPPEPEEVGSAPLDDDQTVSVPNIQSPIPVDEPPVEETPAPEEMASEDDMETMSRVIPLKNIPSAPEEEASVQEEVSHTSTPPQLNISNQEDNEPTVARPMPEENEEVEPEVLEETPEPTQGATHLMTIEEALNPPPQPEETIAINPSESVPPPETSSLELPEPIPTEAVAETKEVEVKKPEPEFDEEVPQFDLDELAPEPGSKSTNDDDSPWRKYFSDFAKMSLRNIKNKKIQLLPMNPAVKLEFLRGVQADTEWTIGYGPRKVGARSVDLPIYESQAPDLCFVLTPTEQGVLFQTGHPDRVQLNDQRVSAEILRRGDIIRIDNTFIEVGFVE